MEGSAASGERPGSVGHPFPYLVLLAEAGQTRRLCSPTYFRLFRVDLNSETKDRKDERLNNSAVCHGRARARPQRWKQRGRRLLNLLSMKFGRAFFSV